MPEAGAETLTGWAAKAAGLLDRFRAEPFGHFIAGRRERGSNRELLDNISPVDGRVTNQISSDERDFDAAARTAQAALPAWRAKTGEERQSILEGVR